MIAPSLVVAAWLIGAWLSAIRAAAARQRLDMLDLFARLLIKSGVAEVDVPVQARVGVVLLFSGGWRWVRYSHGRQPPS
jgi:hypothetical protein